MKNPEEWDDAVAECQRLDALNGRAVVPGEELERVDGGDLPDVVIKAPDAVFCIPERLYPLPSREYWDPEAYEEFKATTLDKYYDSSDTPLDEVIAEQRRLLAERRKTWGQGR